MCRVPFDRRLRLPNLLRYQTPRCGQPLWLGSASAAILPFYLGRLAASCISSASGSHYTPAAGELLSCLERGHGSRHFARESSIKRKAKEFIGEFVELADNADVPRGKIYLLLGQPSHPHFKNAYESAKQMS
jgi:hypothetical protein